MTEALNVFKSKLKPGAKLVVPWGDKGATGHDLGTGETITSPAFPPPEGQVDSLGAGDSFNAALIGSLAHGASLSRDSFNQGSQFNFFTSSTSPKIERLKNKLDLALPESLALLYLQNKRATH